MKLRIHRDQKKTMMSGIHFTVRFKLDVTDEEKKLIGKYGLWKQKMGASNIWSGQTLDVFANGLKVGSEVLGQTVEDVIFETNNVADALTVEKSVVSDCESLKAYLATASSYSGEEEFTFN